jgi:hypothetical protein
VVLGVVGAWERNWNMMVCVCGDRESGPPLSLLILVFKILKQHGKGGSLFALDRRPPQKKRPKRAKTLPSRLRQPTRRIAADEGATIGSKLFSVCVWRKQNGPNETGVCSL